jgi:hypothetical protein
VKFRCAEVLESNAREIDEKVRQDEGEPSYDKKQQARVSHMIDLTLCTAHAVLSLHIAELRPKPVLLGKVV